MIKITYNDILTDPDIQNLFNFLGILLYSQQQLINSVFCAIGLPALLPDFMKGPEYRARMAERRERDDYKPSDSSDSDEEWTPTMNRQKAKGIQSSPVFLYGPWSCAPPWSCVPCILRLSCRTFHGHCHYSKHIKKCISLCPEKIDSARAITTFSQNFQFFHLTEKSQMN